ncbi:MAG: tRNA (adenosine(37)-N6)-threonylcarbamoyltransferase complex dimerization subunit type 1 TsaB [Deltaproteobacteria bacterium]|nr:tRNA (adenosine(37)-N6)-threonylcarbamoyltransferase complex dimerization subunit type 1 TsaB [Deltaproteobacteria bacterium]
MTPESAAAPVRSGTGLTLVLDAAEGPLRLALADAEGRMVFGSSVHAPSRGVEVLAPLLDAALALLDKQAADIARVAAVRGPGSFTGLRLATATAAGLARAVSARQAGLDYMHCLARQCAPFMSDPELQLWVLVRARRDLVYARAYARVTEEDRHPRPLTELAVLPVASGEAAGRIRETASRHNASRVLLAGSGAMENRDILLTSLGSGEPLRAAVLDIAAPTPETLARAACEAEYGDKDIEPLYVRVSDAEANLPQIAGRLGLDPGEAVRQLHALTHSGPDCE